MDLLPLFRWFDSTTIGVVIRNSTYIFPVVEVVHLFGITLLLGTITITDLRILGIGMRRQPINVVASELDSWTMWAGIVAIVSGILLFLSEALKCYGNAAFPYKMWFLLGGVFLYLVFRRKFTTPGASPMQLKIVAVLSLLLWYGVAVAGRAIAFV
jgi:hypothetical protein